MHRYDGKPPKALFKMAIQREHRLWESAAERFPVIMRIRTVLFSK
jgi:hypothetical protein